MQLSLDAAMDHTFSVAEFSQLISDVLGHTFPHDIWVQGEVRGITRAQSGHVYFDLVDAAPEPGRLPDALLPVVLFESTKKTVNAQIKRSGGGMRIDDGVAVRIRASPNFYAPQGKLSLRMTGVDPAYTLGQMAASRDHLLAALADAGLLDRNSRVPFPLLPIRVGLVTSAGSAAEADFVHELQASAVGFQVVLASTPVQGAGAAARIAAAIHACETHGVDVIAVVRGGGAKTDLAVFDDEAVARTIAASTIPVITGVGHEIDTSVADHVAHLALKTPTACAAHLVEAVVRADRRATEVWGAIAATATDRLYRHEQRVSEAASVTRDLANRALHRSDLRRTRAAFRVRELTTTRLDRATARLTTHATTVALESRHQLRDATESTNRARRVLERTARHRLGAAVAAIDGAEERTRLLDPASMLARGWSITSDPQGKVIRSRSEIEPGASLVTRVADGKIFSTAVEPPAGEDEKGA